MAKVSSLLLEESLSWLTGRSTIVPIRASSDTVTVYTAATISNVIKKVLPEIY